MLQIFKHVFSCKDRRRYSRKRATFCRNSADRPSWRLQAPVYACRAGLRLAEAPLGVSGRAVPPPGTRGGYTVDLLVESSAYMELVLDKKTRHLIAMLVLFQNDIISGTNGVCIKKFTAYLLPQRNSLILTNLKFPKKPIVEGIYHLTALVGWRLEGFERQP